MAYSGGVQPNACKGDIASMAAAIANEEYPVCCHPRTSMVTMITTMILLWE